MGLMKADMGGAATVSAAFEAIARLKLPINVTALTPLCENMPSGSANKPGDVVTAMNGKTIEVSCKVDNQKINTIQHFQKVVFYFTFWIKLRLGNNNVFCGGVVSGVQIWTTLLHGGEGAS